MKEAWTPDNCPLQVGSVVYDPRSNSDRMVIRRYLSYDSDCSDYDKGLIALDSVAIYSGRELMDNGFTYYPNWPSTIEEKPCCDEVRDKGLYPVLVGAIHDALVKSHYATAGVHYTEENGIRIWEDDLCTAVNNAADNLAKVFEEYKHDEQ